MSKTTVSFVKFSLLVLVLMPTGSLLAQQGDPPRFTCSGRGGSGTKLVIAGVALSNYQDVYYVGDQMFLAVANGNTGDIVPADYAIIENPQFGSGDRTEVGERTFVSFNLIDPIVHRLEATAVVDQALQTCSLTARVYEVLAISIGTINGIKQNGTQLSFTGTVAGGAGSRSYFWDFGDGQTSNQQNPTHTYDLPGSYTVQFTVSDEFGMSRQATETLVIASNPNIPGQPSSAFQEFTGCGFGQAEYLFTWTPDGSQPSNYYQFQFKPRNSSNWGFKYVQTNNSKLLSNLIADYVYEWRVRGCITSADATCGPYIRKTFRTQSCSSGGGGPAF